MKHFSAMLLFQFRVTTRTGDFAKRVCERRIVAFEARTSKGALSYARKYGLAQQFRKKNSEGNLVRFEFVGVLDLLERGIECDEHEVWWERCVMIRPKERREKLLPKERDLLDRA